MKKKKMKVKGELALEAREGPATSCATTGGSVAAPGQQVVRATASAVRYPKMSAAKREMWRKIRAGELPHPGKVPRPKVTSVNPLFDLTEEQRSKLFTWMRECPYDDAVKQMLRDQGWAEATTEQLNDFFAFEGEQHWEKRFMRAAQEANALVRLAEKSRVQFSSGILAALGQETFRQIASGQMAPEAVAKLANLFLKVRSDERSARMQDLKLVLMRQELDGELNRALDKLGEEVERHPEAREAFAALRRELERGEEGGGGILTELTE